MDWKNILSTAAIKRAYLRVIAFQRADYKQTWEALATSRPVAMVGVASTTDDEDYEISGKSTAKTLQDALGITREDSVLEIGCGTGRIGKHLAPLCKRWIGTDISKGMLSFARQTLHECPNVELVELHQCALDGIDDNSVDCAYCSAVFMHLDEWDRYKYVCEAFRVLRPEGRCYVDNINLTGEDGWSIFLKMANIQPDLRPANISKTSTPEELRTYMEKAGFSDIVLFPGSHFVATRGVKHV